ncbi:MAG: hypothetical protein AAF721_00305 [Myxococcota bacterium]
MSVCKSCKAPITWAITDKGRSIPIDAKPVENGNLVLVREDGPAEMRGQKLLRARAPGLFDAGAPRYVSHFATCPNSKEHRKL